MSTRTRYAAMAACLLVSSVIIGCDSGRTRPPAVAVRMLHAAPQLAPLDFFREQRSEAQLDYLQASGRLFFDADQYDFNIRELDAGGNTTSPVGSFSHELVPGNDYLIAVTESGGALTPVIVERPAFDGSATEVFAVHLAPTLGAMSIYIEPVGTEPPAGTPLGTVSFGQSLEPVARATGDYRLFLTAPGDPADTLLASPQFSLEQNQLYTFAILGPTDDSIAPITVLVLSLDSSLLFDAGTQSALFAVNAVADGDARDLYLDDDFSSPLVDALPYGARSAQTPVPFGSRTLSATPAGNPAAIEDEHTSSFLRSRHTVALIAGEPGDVSVISTIDERRRIPDRARIAFMNGATQFEPLEVFLVPPGTDVSNFSSAVVLDVPGMSTRISVQPGEYEILLRDSDTNVVVAGPAPVTVDGGGLYTVLAVNGDPGTVDLVYLEDFVE